MYYHFFKLSFVLSIWVKFLLTKRIESWFCKKKKKKFTEARSSLGLNFQNPYDALARGRDKKIWPGIETSNRIQLINSALTAWVSFRFRRRCIELFFPNIPQAESLSLYRCYPFLYRYSPFSFLPCYFLFTLAIAKIPNYQVLPHQSSETLLNLAKVKIL